MLFVKPETGELQRRRRLKSQLRRGRGELVGQVQERQTPVRVDWQRQDTAPVHVDQETSQVRPVLGVRRSSHHRSVVVFVCLFVCLFCFLLFLFVCVLLLLVFHGVIILRYRYTVSLRRRYISLAYLNSMA